MSPWNYAADNNNQWLHQAAFTVKWMTSQSFGPPGPPAHSATSKFDANSKIIHKL